jgi:glycosyltransferase involved in cell wall biosynthesis
MIIAIVPTYNEESRIGPVVRGTLPYVDLVVVIDDGSSDQTADIAAQDGALVLKHIENTGAGAATMTGIEAAKRLGATVVVTLDGDGQHDPTDIPAMLAPVIDDHADIVFADRFKTLNRIPFIRRVFNGLGNILTLFSTGKWVSDSQCGFKVFGHRALFDVDLKMSGFEFCTEIVREAVRNKWRIVEVPTKVVYSEYTLAKGQSFAHGVRTAFKILLRSFIR